MVYCCFPSCNFSFLLFRAKQRIFTLMHIHIIRKRLKLITIKLQRLVEVVRYSAVNGLNQDFIKLSKIIVFTNSFFCCCISTEGTYHRQFGKCTCFQIFCIQAKLITYIQKKRLKAHVLKNTHYLISYNIVLKLFGTT